MPKSPVTVPEPLAGGIERSASVDITERESAAEQLSVLLAEAEATGVSERTLDEILAHIRSGHLRPPADMTEHMVREYDASQAFLEKAEQGKPDIKAAIDLLRRR